MKPIFLFGLFFILLALFQNCQTMIFDTSVEIDELRYPPRAEENDMGMDIYIKRKPAGKGIK